jgi:hypothetical protein
MRFRIRTPLGSTAAELSVAVLFEFRHDDQPADNWDYKVFDQNRSHPRIRS